MTVLEECLSPHVAMLQRDHVRLEWCAPYPVLERARSVAWTCFCRATVYELYEGAGRAFVRRTVQLDGGHEIHETAIRSIHETRAIWTGLLSGRAR
ncbi:hypothetical protein SAMN05216275_105200 [Streptosporangium canum]|uniref:Uncharacterized protein n=1 Tax=Streptosporangium canum TaxID=324952 RepID=A0A1I3LM49_9ACTN|nr:hypothetical protein [Streptosporangium canum]SFI85801.1 hypothetical protein SAMN05216275_105200 [Streptosporangium canum]